MQSPAQIRLLTEPSRGASDWLRKGRVVVGRPHLWVCGRQVAQGTSACAGGEKAGRSALSRACSQHLRGPSGALATLDVSLSTQTHHSTPHGQPTLPVLPRPTPFQSLLGLRGQAPVKTSAGGLRLGAFWLGTRCPERLLVAHVGRKFTRSLME